jgi:TonB family protein
LAALAFLLLSPTIFPQQMQTALKFDAVELKQPVTHIDIDIAPTPTPPQPPPPKLKPKVRPPDPKPILPKTKPITVEPPELNARKPHVFLVLKPELPKAHKVEAKPVELRPVFQSTEIVLTSKQPARPKDEVKVTNLSSGGPASATVAAPPNKVQTGGFGDPNGIPGAGNPNKAANINQAGSQNLPGGPGSGNGTGGAQGLRGTVASEGPNSGAPVTGGATSTVDILYEPNPAYSNEARIIKMEGDVVLEVIFLASGQLQVTRVVNGLGHGLDEAAIQAAKQIRFRPAKRNGQPVDFSAHVRIEFRLSK